MVPLASSNSESPTHGPGGERPVGDAEFAQLVDRLGPFERTPHIAAGVSGGADSLALALLADRWVRRRGGRLTALIVDHRLRSGSAEEAATVRRRRLVAVGSFAGFVLVAGAAIWKLELIERWVR